MRATTAKPLVALALTGAGTILVVGFHVPETPAIDVGANTSTSSTGSTTGTTAKSAATPAPAATGSGTTPGSTAGTTSATPAPAAATPSATTAAGQYADGTWTGAAVREPWGTFTVQAVVSGGQLTAVTLVSAPSDSHSSRINAQAVPILTQAAIAAQSANIDLVSGATWTSQSYETSLQAALDQAKAAAEVAGQA
jgi:uncharacterized protein with FMN-binding domain